MRRHSLAILLLVVPLAPLAALAQAAPAATRTPIQVGAAFSFASPDFPKTSDTNLVNPYIQGFHAFGDIGLARRLSAEIEYNDLDVVTPRDFGQKSFLAGPRFSFALEDRANLYVKAMGGVGQFVYQVPSYQPPHTDSYGVVALGGGIEFRLSRHINLRPIDVEFQRWIGFAGGLSPFATSVGFAYIY